MKNQEIKIQSIKENYNSNEYAKSNMDFRGYIEQEAENDPNFFRWLFSEELEEDFDSSLNDEQREEYSKFLNEVS